MAINNIDFINAIRTSASDEFKNRIPLVTKNNITEVATLITDYPNIKNAFIDVLTNQVAKVKFMQKLYDNPLKFFKKGSLPYGKTIESIFIDLVQAKGYNENFGTGNTEVSDLISVEKPKHLKVEYYTENFQNKYKISINDSDLKGAFRDETGLSTLTQKLLIAPLNSAEFDEYLMIRQILGNLTVKEISLNGYSSLDDNAKAKMVTKACKTLVNKFRFLNDGYNSQGVKTFCKPNEVVILVTPETQANIDVELLASSFNMDKAQVESRVVLIDEFVKESGVKGSQTYVTDTDTVAIVCDESLIQFYETENTTESQRLANKLVTNLFYHRWGIMCGCGFVNAVKIKKGA